jgi:hypothetical protein
MSDKPRPQVEFRFPGDEFIRVGGRALEENLKSNRPEDAEYDAAISGMESLLLALSSEGVDLSTPPAKAAVQTAAEAIANEFA